MFNDLNLLCISMIPKHQVSLHSNKFQGVKSDLQDGTNLVISMVHFNRKFPQICYGPMKHAHFFIIRVGSFSCSYFPYLIHHLKSLFIKVQTTDVAKCGSKVIYFSTIKECQLWRKILRLLLNTNAQKATLELDKTCHFHVLQNQ